MTKPLTVINKEGEQVERADGVMLDGDRVQSIRVPLMFADNASTVTAATLASAAQILGDGFSEAEIAKLSDQAARHAVVRKKLGVTANGRPAQFLDSAWNALTGSQAGAPKPAAATVALPMFTDAQRAFAASAVKQAVAEAGNPPQRVQDAKVASRAQVPLPPRRSGMLTDAERQAGNDRIRGSYCAMKAAMNDEWRGAPQPETVLDARTEAAFRDGKITDNPTNRARAELAQTLADGWKERG